VPPNPLLGLPYDTAFIRDFLLASQFRARFLNKGVMRGFLTAVPVRLIEHGQLGVFGAAAIEIEAAARTD